VRRLLARGQLGRYHRLLFNSLLNLEAPLALIMSDIVALKYPTSASSSTGKHQLSLAMTCSRATEAVQGFLRAFNKALQETIFAIPDSAICFMSKTHQL